MNWGQGRGIVMRRYEEAYISYLIHYHTARDYFECHEIMEEFWKQRPEDPLRDTYEGLIQLAVGLYHQRRGNRRGAAKMLEGALAHMKPAHLERLGIDAAPLREAVASRLAALRGGEEGDYADIDIPLTDEELLASCLAVSGGDASVWGGPSNLENVYLVHKHTLRDRSEVRSERERQRERKREERTKRDQA